MQVFYTNSESMYELKALNCVAPRHKSAGRERVLTLVLMVSMILPILSGSLSSCVRFSLCDSTLAPLACAAGGRCSVTDGATGCAGGGCCSAALMGACGGRAVLLVLGVGAMLM